MNTFIKLFAAALSAIAISGSAFAQDLKDMSLKSKEDKTQEIIIRKKGANTEKMTIVVDGDHVTINGKPAEDFKNDVTVLRRNGSPGMAPRIRNFQNGRLDYNDARINYLLTTHSNKALLGVMTAKADNGVKITEVTKESGAEKAGLTKDDIITKVGNTEVKEPADVAKAIGEYKPNDKVDITYKRNGKENKTTVALGENKSKHYSYNFNSDNDFNFEMPTPPMPPSMENFNFNFNRKPRIGLQIQDVEEGKGVTVKDVDDESPAAKAGMKEGDIITQVNGKDVEGVDDLRNQIKDIKDGDMVKFSYKRDGKSQSAEIKIPKKLKSADL